MYTLRAALRRDANEGYVRLTKGDFILRSHRSVIMIKNKENKVYCEYIEIDENFIKEYNHPPRVPIANEEKTVVINKWYREKLGKIETKRSYDLQITSANGLWGKFRAWIGHPQLVVRLSGWLAAISLGLGLLSIFQALMSKSK